MSEKLQDLSNTREVKQRQIMEELACTGECFLCENVLNRISKKYQGVVELPVLHGDHWFIKPNDFPYAGTKLHLLIVPKRHVSEVEALLPVEFNELQQMVSWVNATYHVQGASMFIRYGDMSYTGATLAHMHFHILHGVKKHDDALKIKPTLGYV